VLHVLWRWRDGFCGEVEVVLTGGGWIVTGKMGGELGDDWNGSWGRPPWVDLVMGHDSTENVECLSW